MGLIERLLGRDSAPGADVSSRGASVPDDTVVYAIGDVHGRLDLLEAIERKIVDDAQARPQRRRVIVCLGDYVDRGYESRAVVEHLLASPPEGFERICLKGNHEAFLVDFLDDAALGPSWFANGGVETLLSYGVDIKANADPAEVQGDFRARLPDDHRDFLAGLQLSHREGDYLFVHAGVRPGVELDRQTPADLMWIRGEFLNDSRDHGAIVVHGHTVESEPQVRANRIGIDTGAYATSRLTCLVLAGTGRDFLTT